MKKLPMSLIVGAASILVTILMYFVILGDVFLEIICILTLVGVVVAEIITTGYAYFSKGDPRKVAATLVSAAMIPIAVILSVVYIIGFPYAYGTYIALYIAALIIDNVIAFMLLNFANNRQKENASFQNAKENMLYLRKIVKCIMADSDAAAYKKELSAIEEKLHFSTDNVIAIQDNEIREMLMELQTNISNPEFDVPQSLMKISKTIDLRNAMCSRTV